MHTCTALIQLKDLTNTSAALEERVHELERAEQQLQCQLQQQVWKTEKNCPRVTEIVCVSACARKIKPELLQQFHNFSPSLLPLPVLSTPALSHTLSPSRPPCPAPFRWQANTVSGANFATLTSQHRELLARALAAEKQVDTKKRRKREGEQSHILTHVHTHTHTHTL
jgi:hypothetical protein